MRVLSRSVRVQGQRLHLFDRDVRLTRQRGTVFELGHGIHNPAAAPRHFEAHRANRRLDPDDLPLEPPALRAWLHRAAGP